MNSGTLQSGSGVIKSYQRLLALFERSSRRSLLWLLLLMLVGAVLEAFSVAAILPFMLAVVSPEASTQHPFLGQLKEVFGIDSDERFRLLLACAFCFSVLLSTAIKAFNQYAQLAYSARQGARWSERLLANYLSKPYVWHSSHHSAELGRSVLAQVQDVVNQSLLPALNLLVHAAVALALLFTLAWVLPWFSWLASLALVLLYAAIYRVLRARLQAAGKAKISHDVERHRLVAELFGGIKEVKVMRLEGHYLARLKPTLSALAQLLGRTHLYSMLPKHVLESLGFILLTMVALSLLASAQSPAQSVSVLSLFGFAAYRLLPAVQNIYQAMVALRLNAPALALLHHDLSPTTQPPPSKFVPAPAALAIKHSIRLQDIGFRYPGSALQALSEVTLELTAKQTIALVGESGAGKTTLADLLMGLHQPDQGTLLIDELALDDSRMSAWQASIGYVPQHIFLADASIAENVAFGVARAQIDRQRVWHALRLAKLETLVRGELPDQLETKVGERGARLSGGQRQRLGIARALYRDPQVLIFDEATSALDQSTEHDVMQAIEQLRGEKTIIVIAHRMSTVKRADHIVMLERGRVLAQGSFAYLEQHCTAFRAMTMRGELIEAGP
jgi:ABC-type bacteriocin/lantibiotic exporter with double-glycine peptidase domain